MYSSPSSVNLVTEISGMLLKIFASPILAYKMDVIESTFTVL